MKRIDVKASGCYSILVGRGLYEGLGELIKENFPKCQKILLLSDEKVFSLYGETVGAELSASFSLSTFLVPQGEDSKSLSNYCALLESMAQEQFKRSDLLVALGGGVIGDLGGFAAASYLRGIDFVGLPTTLLAAVDSSVGGKTAVNLAAGKNLAGAFHQPGLVVMDTESLESLERETLKDGCGEVLKYAVLKDAALFERLKRDKDYVKSEECIARCIEIKKEYVEEDEFDRGVRQFLNLGHTVGHAIEKRSNYACSHGKAVALGMAVMARCACSLGILEKEGLSDILSLLCDFGFETRSPYTAEELLPLMLSDKKRMGGNITLVLPEKIGNCVLYELDVKELGDFVKKGLMA